MEQNLWLPHREQGLTVIGVNTGGLGGGDDEARIRKFIDETGVTFPIVRDNTRSHLGLATGRGISPFPIDVVIDRQGRISYLASEYNPEGLEQAVQQALAGQP